MKTTISWQLCGNDEIDDEELLLIANPDGRANIDT
jgi:hypothetical protein